MVLESASFPRQSMVSRIASWSTEISKLCASFPLSYNVLKVIHTFCHFPASVVVPLLFSSSPFSLLPPYTPFSLCSFFCFLYTQCPRNSRQQKLHSTARGQSVPGLATLSIYLRSSHRGAAIVFEVSVFWALTKRRRPNQLEPEKIWKQLVRCACEMGCHPRT